ncbi:MAG: M14 family zinc carboxypeptidase [Gammaproteobacteria bacterium]
MKLFSTLVLALMLPLAHAQEKPVEGWPKETERVVVRAFFETQDQLQKFAEQTAPWKVDRKKGYLIVDADEQQVRDMTAAGFRVELDSDRTQRMNSRLIVDGAQRAGIPGFSCYRTVDETLATGAQLAAEFPNLATWIDAGDSWEKENGFGGSDMMVLKLTNSAISGDKPKLFTTSAIHAREYTTAELNTRFAEYLLNNYGTDADATWILDHHEVHLMLQTNPDGRRRAQTGILWRKNTNQNLCGAGSNDRGADLNRNFAYEWGCCGGSSGSQCSTVYRGPGPGSEPEVASVQNYLRSIFDDARGPGATDAAPADTSGVYIDIHSFSELVLWPWGYTDTVAPNGNAMQTLGRRLAWFNNYNPEQAVELYITDGTTDDFAYGDLGVAAYTYELGTTFFQDCATFENTILPDNLPSLVYAAKSARAPYLLPSGPDALDVSLSSGAIGPGDAVTVSAEINDTRFRNSNGTEPTQSVTEAQYSIDTPPWEAGATLVAMTATDGSFSSNVEQASAVMDTAGLSQGRHTVYVRGRDASGQWGNVSAQFLFVIDPVTAPRISGRVTAADTGGGLAATVTAGTFSTTTDAAGNYELLLIAGSYDLTITPNDETYGAASLASVAATDSQTNTQNFSLFPFCALFSDDMESSDVAWTTQGSWARTNGQSNSGSFSYTDSPDGEYGNNVSASLISPPLDLSQVGTISLDFASRCDTEATYDFCYVEVSSDGANWTQLDRFDGFANSFSNQSYTTGALAGSANAQIRFRFESDVTVTEDGWYVDDVVVRGAGAQCVTVTDTDGDGANDLIDNCTLVANPTQLDTNGDGFGNACDADLNNDNIVNVVDLGLLRSSFFATGAQDADFNGDGVVNVVDLGIMRSYFFQAPGPAAGTL